jgi:RNAse (barnase) inhibitor barstar
VDAIKYFYDQRQAAGIRVQQPLELRRKALDAAKLKGAQRTRAVNDIVEEIEEEFSRNMPSWASS